MLALQEFVSWGQFLYFSDIFIFILLKKLKVLCICICIYKIQYFDYSVISFKILLSSQSPISTPLLISLIRKQTSISFLNILKFLSFKSLTCWVRHFFEAIVKYCFMFFFSVHMPFVYRKTTNFMR